MCDSLVTEAQEAARYRAFAEKVAALLLFREAIAGDLDPGESADDVSRGLDYLEGNATTLEALIEEARGLCPQPTKAGAQ